MTTEIRDIKDGVHLAVYTEDEPTRKQLKALPGYAFECFYFIGKKMVAVDVYLDKSLLPDGLRRKMQQEARKVA